MTRNHLIPTLIAIAAGLAGLLIVLYAWHLPPFQSSQPQTENAYIRGKVTSLAPQLSGYIAGVEVQDFQPVPKGQVIARIDDRQYKQKLAQAQAALLGAEAALKIQNQSVHSAQAGQQSAEAAMRAAEAARDTAKSNWDRASALQTRGVTAQSSADQTELALRQAEAAVTQAESAIAGARENVNGAQVGLAARQAEIASAQAAVELAQIDLSNTVIHAPADGRLGQVSVRLGQYVTAGTALVSLVGNVDAMQGRVFTGRVEAFSPAAASEFSLLSASNATGNFTKVAQRLPVRISIDPGQERAEFLEPGLSVVVTVDEGTAGQAADGQSADAQDKSAQAGAMVMGNDG